MKTAIVVLCLAASAVAQRTAASNLQGACGPMSVNFKTEVSATQPPQAPEPGKALVFVVEDFPMVGRTAVNPTIKVGLDGAWIGATHARSYIFFSVDPGEHHLCINWQSHLEAYSNLRSLAQLRADAGKIYYFRARVFFQEPYIDLNALDADEARYLIASSQLSSSRAKE